MNRKSGERLSEQQIQMHNEKIAAMLTQAFTRPNVTISEVKVIYTEFLKALEKGEI